MEIGSCGDSSAEGGGVFSMQSKGKRSGCEKELKETLKRSNGGLRDFCRTEGRG